MTDSAALLKKHSFVELGARQRAKALLDAGTFRELLDPFQRVMSPWLERQGVVPQADDGVIIAKGRLDGLPVVIAAIEGAFQGGSLGEVGGAKIAGALELAASVPPMAYDIDSYASLGLLWETLSVQQIEQPTEEDLTRVTECLKQAISDVTSTDLKGRLGASNRAASSKVRELLRAQW